MFLAEKTQRGNLKKNRSAAYARWKKRQKLPFGNKRGHLTGKLQRALDKLRLYQLNYSKASGGKTGRATIVLKENILIKRVPHYKYYRKNKTPGTLGVLLASKKIADKLQKRINELAKKGQRRTGTNNAINKLVKGTKRKKRSA